MPGYHDDERVLQVIVEDVEESVDKRRLRGKDERWWRALSDAMWDMIDMDIAVDLANNSVRADKRAERGGIRTRRQQAAQHG
jgi:hypothetical protein